MMTILKGNTRSDMSLAIVPKCPKALETRLSTPVTPLPGLPTRHGSDIIAQAASCYNSVGGVGWVLTVGRQEGKSRGGQTGISALSRIGP